MIRMNKEPGSFRDPVAQVFKDERGYIRMITPRYFYNYDLLMRSGGVYDHLVTSGLMVPHTEEKRNSTGIWIRPQTVPFISYPSEWTFTMLKRAALNALYINKIAISHGMILKDAPATNWQYLDREMRLIDTTSFVKYEAGMPWFAYREYLQNFLCPLLIMQYQGAGYNRLSEAYLGGITIPTAAHILPMRAKFRLPLLAHFYSQLIRLDINPGLLPKMPRIALLSLLDSLEKLIRSINYKNNLKKSSEWVEYYEKSGSYTDYEQAAKRDFVSGLFLLPPASVCDIGANTGAYSFIAESHNHEVISIDYDHDCMDFIARDSWKCNVLPLVVDITNPTPAAGWGNQERKSFLDRLHVDTIMALAVIHHICVKNNVPLAKVAELFSDHCKNLIIEWVPPEDPQVKRLVRIARNYPRYDVSEFMTAFLTYFNAKNILHVGNGREVYLFIRR